MITIKELIDTDLESIVFDDKKDPSFRETLGRKLKEKRKEKNISQKILSFRSGISQANISKIEKGSLNISLDILERYVKGLELSIIISFE